MKRLSMCTLFFVALMFAVAPSALAGQVAPVPTNSTAQMLEGPVPWPPPGHSFEGPVPWPGPGLVRGLKQV
jgi:hypothetical protein